MPFREGGMRVGFCQQAVLQLNPVVVVQALPDAVFEELPVE